MGGLVWPAAVVRSLRASDARRVPMATVEAGGGQLPGGARESGRDADQLRADRAGCGLGMQNGREDPAVPVS